MSVPGKPAISTARSTWVAPAGPAAGLPSRRPAVDARILSAGAIAAFFAAWEVLSRLGIVDPLFFSSPTAIARKGAAMVASGELWDDLLVSGQEFLLGYALSVVVGTVLGIAIGWYRSVGAVFNPFVAGLNVTPRVALLPLIIMWFGIGVGSKVVFIFLMTIFPVLVNTATAMRALEPALVEASRSFGASDRDIFFTVALPASVPFIVSGLRLAAALGLIGVVVGELHAASRGVGHLISTAGARFRADEVFVGILIIALFGILLDTLLQRMEARVDRWRVKQP